MNFFECYEKSSNNNDQLMSCLTDTFDSIKNTTEENFLSSLDEQILDFARAIYLSASVIWLA